MGFQSVFERYADFWNMTNDDRPLIHMTAPKKVVPSKPPAAPESVQQRWLDTEYQLKLHRYNMEATHYLGEAVPVFNPNLGPDILGAACGCDLQFGESTSWAEPCVDDYDRFPPIVFDEKNPWWQKICEITKAAVEDAKGDYLVGITDLHPGADAIVSLRGAEAAAMDIYDEPEQFKARVWEIHAVFQSMTEGLHQIISPGQKGCTNWMGVIHPEKMWYVTSCDFSYMISPAHFEEFIAPELEAELDWLPASIFHLDGIGSLRHLDRLLAMEKLKGIQWVYGAGQPSAVHWADVYRKIQNAGKCLEIPCEMGDVIPLCEVLDPQGVRFNFGVPDKESGEALLRDVERIYRHKRGIYAMPAGK